MNTRALQLSRLYKLRALGYQYDESPLPARPSADNHLPDDLESLHHIVAQCHLCALGKTRINPVFGEGNPQAEVMFIGEGPGVMEDASGRPFVGRAGELLTKMIENVLEIPRSQVYIANIVKCRPPNNRVPTPAEAEACRPFLLKQISQIKPRLIVALGATSYFYLTGDKTGISRVRGNMIVFDSSIQLIPTFHPSFLLRNPSAKKEVYHDLLKVKSCLHS